MQQYLYTIKFTVFEENLCKMEMKYLFGKTPEAKYIFSHNYIDPSRSPFIKQCISIKYTGENPEKIVSKILEDNLSYDRFKVCFINLDDEKSASFNEGISYAERLEIERLIGFNIAGEADIHNPEILLAITRVNGRWIFGEYTINKLTWKLHDKKPYYYSNALGVRVARALVNIAVANNMNCRLIDPCCGIGTVVMEALSMGIHIKGYEINPLIAENAKKNLEFFGYKDVIENADMHTIEGKYDAAIVDLPYGVFNPTTLKEQVDIMKTARRLADRMVIITFEDMDKHLVESGFEITDKSHVSKGRFKRYITLCK